MTEGKKILLVEDDQNAQNFYRELLTNEGYGVELADNGNQGFKKIQEGGYDLILLDIVLPGIDGEKILQKLKKEPPKQKNGPIVVLSNLIVQSTIQSALENGAATYFSKSDITPDQLLKQIRLLLSPLQNTSS